MFRQAIIKLFVTALLVSSPSFAASKAKTVEINGDYGCTSKMAQELRLEMLSRAMTSTDESMRQRFAQQVADITNKQCLQLNGRFRVKAKSTGMVEIESNGQKLWVLQ